MSLQSNCLLDTQNDQIWQCKDVEPNTTSIFHLSGKFITDQNLFSQQIAKAEKETKCSISIHGQNTDLVWIKIKSSSTEARRNAINMINEVTNKSCKEIFLPDLFADKPKESSTNNSKNNDAKNSPSSPLSPSNSHSNRAPVRAESFSHKQRPQLKHDNFIHTNNGDTIMQTSSTLNNPNSYYYSNPAKKETSIESNGKKTSLTRSSTENFISSIASNKSLSSLSPFGSVLSPITPNRIPVIKEETTNGQQQNSKTQNKNAINTIHEVNDENENEKKPNNAKQPAENKDKYKLKLRYTLDFLLLRADTPVSKNMPLNWKDLNQKYPTVCFCGKVLSYFDPYKYYEFWEKTKLQNYELHNTSKSFDSNHTTSPSSSTSTATKPASLAKKNYQPEKSYTDDFLNMKSSIQKDLNNNNNGYSAANNKIYQKAIRRQDFAPVGFSNNNGFTNNNETSQSYRKAQFNNQQQLSFQNQQQISSAFYPQETHLKRYQSAKIYNGYNN